VDLAESRHARPNVNDLAYLLAGAADQIPDDPAEELLVVISGHTRVGHKLKKFLSSGAINFVIGRPQTVVATPEYYYIRSPTERKPE
jgi:hypothetical protein